MPSPGNQHCGNNVSAPFHSLYYYLSVVKVEGHSMTLLFVCLSARRSVCLSHADSSKVMHCRTHRYYSKLHLLWLWPATDHEPHCRHVPINKIWRWTESTPRSGRWQSYGWSLQRLQHSRNNNKYSKLTGNPCWKSEPTGLRGRILLRPEKWGMGLFLKPSEPQPLLLRLDVNRKSFADFHLQWSSASPNPRNGQKWPSAATYRFACIGATLRVESHSLIGPRTWCYLMRRSKQG